MRTFLGVGTTGLIFGVIVIAWLVYLVPMYLRRDSTGQIENPDPATRFSADVQIVQHGEHDASAAESSRVRVSTPLTRRAAVLAIRQAERRAAGRRRNVVVVLVLALAILGVFCGLGKAAAWTLIVPGALLVGFLAIARVSVRVMHADFDRRLAAIEGLDGDRESTVAIVAEQSGRHDARKRRRSEASIELSAPVGEPGSLWDPLPITRPTYVSSPPVQRMVRTIDLSAPAKEQAESNAPVVADGPAGTADVEKPTPGVVESDRRPRAVGE